MTSSSRELSLQDIVRSAIEESSGAAGSLLQVLKKVQARLNYVSEEAVRCIAEQMAVPLTNVEATLDFYAHLYAQPFGQYRILFSDNITDRMQHNQALLQQMCQFFDILPGQCRADGLVSIGTTSCTGMCDQGPALLINDLAIPRLTPQRVEQIAQLIEERQPLARWPAALFQVASNIQRPDLLLSKGCADGTALRLAIHMGADGFLQALTTAKLRGRGGAGFPTAQKWRSCLNTPVSEPASRIIVCNADEGEPGTFKDRVLLQTAADRVFEGMTIAAYTLGARQGFLYLRGEYQFLLPQLQQCLQSRQQQNLLGQNILGQQGFDFNIHIHMGAGAYICGEETALIESLEGKPGRPRIRPPYPANVGYLGQPTVVNNVETLALVTLVAEMGGAAFDATGYQASTGTKILSIAGDCAHPGIYEYPFGVTIKEILHDCGGADAIAVQVGGASGVCLAKNEFSRRLSFEDVPSAGAFMIFNGERDMFEAARNFAQFFNHESCGFCTPCRVGCALQRNIMDKIATGHGTRYEMDELTRIMHVMQTSSHCGLGQTAGLAIRDTMLKFRPAYERRLVSTDFLPAFDLDAALAKSRKFTERDDALAHFGY